MPKASTLTNYIPVTESGCWLWTGAVDGVGYGRVKREQSREGIGPRKRKGLGAHRFFYEAFVGPIPAGLFVCHKCDTRLCVNPSHMFIGTCRQNLEDMASKGRAKNVNRKKPRRLSAAEREQIVGDTRKLRVIAEEYGIAANTVTYLRVKAKKERS